MVDSHSRFLREILKANNVPESEADLIARDVALQSEAVQERRALEKAIGSSESYAYLWSDLVSLESAVKVIGASLKGEAQLAGIKALLKFWMTLRDVRVELSEEEAKVLRVVKRSGDSGVTFRELAQLLPDFDEGPLQTCVMDLKNKRYKDHIPLLEERGGRYVTRF